LVSVVLWLAPYSLVQEGNWVTVAMILGLALVAVIAALSRLPSSAAEWMARRRSERYLAFSSVWLSCGGLLAALLVVAFPAAVFAAGIPLRTAYWVVIGGAAASALINLWALVSNFATRPPS
jgi:hypothetical protein